MAKTVRMGMLLAAAMLGLSGCGTLWGDGEERGDGDLALAALTRGDYALAEQRAAETLRAAPKDPYALLAMALIHQRMGQYDRARGYYETILATQPQGTVAVGGGLRDQPITEVARQNLAQMNMAPAPAAPPSGAAAPAAPANKAAAAPVAQGVPPRELDAVAQRFATLQRLAREGLITRQEHDERRAANVAAMLPYSAAQPAGEGLDRPPPDDEQLVERMKSLAKALEMRAVSQREYTVERTAILDALLPDKPRGKANPPVAVSEPLAAAAIYGRLERLRELGLISADEQKAERAAVEKSVDGALAARAPAAGAPQALAPPAAALAPAAKPAGGMAVHLASLRSEDEARAAWRRIKDKNAVLLSGMEAEISRVDLPGKGIYWRVKAGPVADRAAAEELCRQLKRRSQYCEPAFPGKG